jgi:hypothetical protein
MQRVRESYTKVPAQFHGRWQVISCRSPGEIASVVTDIWGIYPDRIETQEFVFLVASVSADIEPDQDLHLISFSNHGFQFALLRSKTQPGKLLVTWYLSGKEVRRFLIMQKTPSRDSDTMPYEDVNTNP